MGFPPEYFTVLFAIPRMAGYLAHWRESLDDPDTKIMRPQQVFCFLHLLYSQVLTTNSHGLRSRLGMDPLEYFRVQFSVYLICFAWKNYFSMRKIVIKTLHLEALNGIHSRPLSCIDK